MQLLKNFFIPRFKSVWLEEKQRGRNLSVFGFRDELLVVFLGGGGFCCPKANLQIHLLYSLYYD